MSSASRFSSQNNRGSRSSPRLSGQRGPRSSPRLSGQESTPGMSMPSRRSSSKTPTASQSIAKRVIPVPPDPNPIATTQRTTRKAPTKATASSAASMSCSPPPQTSAKSTRLGESSTYPVNLTQTAVPSRKLPPIQKKRTSSQANNGSFPSSSKRARLPSIAEDAPTDLVDGLKPAIRNMVLYGSNRPSTRQHPGTLQHDTGSNDDDMTDVTDSSIRVSIETGLPMTNSVFVKAKGDDELPEGPGSSAGSVDSATTDASKIRGTSKTVTRTETFDPFGASASLQAVHGNSTDAPTSIQERALSQPPPGQRDESLSQRFSKTPAALSSTLDTRTPEPGTISRAPDHRISEPRSTRARMLARLPAAAFSVVSGMISSPNGSKPKSSNTDSSLRNVMPPAYVTPQGQSSPPGSSGPSHVKRNKRRRRNYDSGSEDDITLSKGKERAVMSPIAKPNHKHTTAEHEATLSRLRRTIAERNAVIASQKHTISASKNQISLLQSSSQPAPQLGHASQTGSEARELVNYQDICLELRSTNQLLQSQLASASAQLALTCSQYQAQLQAYQAQLQTQQDLLRNQQAETTRRDSKIEVIKSNHWREITQAEEKRQRLSEQLDEEKFLRAREVEALRKQVEAGVLENLVMQRSIAPPQPQPESDHARSTGASDRSTNRGRHHSTNGRANGNFDKERVTTSPKHVFDADQVPGSWPVDPVSGPSSTHLDIGHGEDDDFHSDTSLRKQDRPFNLNASRAQGRQSDPTTAHGKGCDSDSDIGLGHDRVVAVDNKHEKVRECEDRPSHLDANHEQDRPSHLDTSHEQDRPSHLDTSHEQGRPSHLDTSHEQGRPSHLDTSHEQGRPSNSNTRQEGHPSNSTINHRQHDGLGLAISPTELQSTSDLAPKDHLTDSLKATSKVLSSPEQGKHIISARKSQSAQHDPTSSTKDKSNPRKVQNIPIPSSKQKEDTMPTTISDTAQLDSTSSTKPDHKQRNGKDTPTPQPRQDLDTISAGESQSARHDLSSSATETKSNPLSQQDTASFQPLAERVKGRHDVADSLLPALQLQAPINTVRRTIQPRDNRTESETRHDISDNHTHMPNNHLEMTGGDLASRPLDEAQHGSEQAQSHSLAKSQPTPLTRPNFADSGFRSTESGSASYVPSFTATKAELHLASQSGKRLSDATGSLQSNGLKDSEQAQLSPPHPAGSDPLRSASPDYPEQLPRMRVKDEVTPTIAPTHESELPSSTPIPTPACEPKPSSESAAPSAELEPSSKPVYDSTPTLTLKPQSELKSAPSPRSVTPVTLTEGGAHSIRSQPSPTAARTSFVPPSHEPTEADVRPVTKASSTFTNKHKEPSSIIGNATPLPLPENNVRILEESVTSGGHTEEVYTVSTFLKGDPKGVDGEVVSELGTGAHKEDLTSHSVHESQRGFRGVDLSEHTSDELQQGFRGVDLMSTLQMNYNKASGGST
ncbi:hypothetical protein P153DRAFT_145876 [Dothidotthia symphoricarpi CBS 119687]|uniref:Uncharacterized protein n=1 Tax=Dothidotthia symphoricarpi CBS 119687 TaxID=1392245 RepID=A0A6A5ZW03_9PLEO|nr:uncharacterized protein P153DRAFT_145876 [Dothidotthia symphoricarpi CBS 119687]KAF2123770.1 hypothetical protein P153DRAFT_145876 [Dothidotthia symphoricarpi CBS 119687]